MKNYYLNQLIPNMHGKKKIILIKSVDRHYESIFFHKLPLRDHVYSDIPAADGFTTSGSTKCMSLMSHPGYFSMMMSTNKINEEISHIFCIMYNYGIKYTSDSMLTETLMVYRKGED